MVLQSSTCGESSRLSVYKTHGLGMKLEKYVLCKPAVKSCGMHGQIRIHFLHLNPAVRR